MKNHNLVSVIVPVYNRTEFICSALQSIANQEYPHIETIVVDDGSEIDIKNFIDKNYPLAKVTFIKKTHTGLSDTLNFGIDHAKGEFLAFLDDDDLWHPHMISSAINKIEEKKMDLAAVGYRYFQQALDPTQLYDHFEIVDSPSSELLKDLIRNNLFPVNTIVVRRELIQKIGGFNVKMNAAMDWDLWVRMIASNVKLVFVNECLTFIRVHENNMSRNDALMQRGRLEVLLNAMDYFDSSQKRATNLKGELAFRKLISGWYILIYESKKEGRKLIFGASRKNIIFLLPSIALILISLLPASLLKKMTRSIEFTFRKQNRFRGT